MPLVNIYTNNEPDMTNIDLGFVSGYNGSWT